MEVSITFDNIAYKARLDKPLSIAIPAYPNQANVNCYWAEEPSAQVIEVGDFVGSVARGGTVNYQRLSLTPHGNGTHTECIGHITDDPAHTLAILPKRSFFKAQVISLRPKTFGEDAVITLNDVHDHFDKSFKPEALIIRSLPNDIEQKSKARYSGTNPPYLEPAVGEWLAARHVKHLLVDLPSVDKEVDGGDLNVHRGFWQSEGLNPRIESTITELILVPNAVVDGRYLLQLSLPLIGIDAMLTHPVLYKLEASE